MNASVSACPATRTEAAATSPQLGQGMVEFLLAAVPVLLIGLSSIEAVHWYFARQAVSLALSQAARAAITQHADPAVLDAAFARALLPLYAATSRAGSHARLQKAMARREHATGLPAWKIHIVSPSTATFSDFSSDSPDLPRTGKPVIDNDYLHEQHQTRAQGRSPQSGQNVLEANTLILALTWLHEPLLPGVKQLLRQIAPADSRYSSQAMARAGYLPLRRQVALMMQSHAVAWDMPAHGRISRAAHSAESPHRSEPDAPIPAPQAPGSTALTGVDPPSVNLNLTHGPNDDQAAAQPCEGLWCLRDYLEDEVPPAEGGLAQGEESSAQGGPHSDTASHWNGDYLGADAETEPDDCPGCCP